MVRLALNQCASVGEDLMDEYIPAIVLFLELLIVVVGGYYIMH